MDFMQYSESADYPHASGFESRGLGEKNVPGLKKENQSHIYLKHTYYQESTVPRLPGSLDTTGSLPACFPHFPFSSAVQQDIVGDLLLQLLKMTPNLFTF